MTTNTVNFNKQELIDYFSFSENKKLPRSVQTLALIGFMDRFKHDSSTIRSVIHEVHSYWSGPISGIQQAKDCGFSDEEISAIWGDSDRQLNVSFCKAEWLEILRPVFDFAEKMALRNTSEPESSERLTTLTLFAAYLPLNYITAKLAEEFGRIDSGASSYWLSRKPEWERMVLSIKHRSQETALPPAL